jgi:hypothetical protein
LTVTRDAHRNRGFFVFTAILGQDAVAVSLAAKHKTDGYGFWAAVRNRNLLILYKQLVVSQAPSKARCSSRANPSKIQAK